MFWKVVLEENHKQVFKKECQKRDQETTWFLWKKKECLSKTDNRKKDTSEKFKNTIFLTNPSFFTSSFFVWALLLLFFMSCFYKVLLLLHFLICFSRHFLKFFCQHRFFVSSSFFFLLIPFFLTSFLILVPKNNHFSKMFNLISFASVSDLSSISSLSFFKLFLHLFEHFGV